MSVCGLDPAQPESFAFDAENMVRAKKTIGSCPLDLMVIALVCEWAIAFGEVDR
jgi:hypothetical protein